jgi:RNA polymerase sigma factor (sigma-70 family)
MTKTMDMVSKNPDPLGPNPVERWIGHIFGPSGPTLGCPDADLLDRFRHSRDASAFEAIVLRHGPMVLAICRDALRGAGLDSADAFQATFLLLLRRATTIRDGRQLGSWLRLTARRVCSNARRRRPIDSPLPPTAELVDPAAPSPPALAQQGESLALLHDELERLPAPFRDAITLTHLDGLTHEEAAHVLGCPLGTVRSRVARGREQLKARLARLGLPALLPSPGLRLRPASLPPSYLQAATRLVSHPPTPRVAALAQIASLRASAGLLAARSAALAAMAALVAALASGPGAPSSPTPTPAPLPAPAAFDTPDDPTAPLATALTRALADLPPSGEKAASPLRSSPRDMAIWSLIQLGALQAATSQPEPAQASFQTALRLASHLDPGVHRGAMLARLGRSQALAGNLESARTTINLARDDLLPRATRPDTPAVYELRTLAAAQAQLGDTASLDTTLDRLRTLAAPAPGDLGPTDPVQLARAYLVWTLARTGRADEALQRATDPLASGLPLATSPEAPDWLPLQTHRIEGLRAVFESLIPEQGPSARDLLDRAGAWIEANPNALGGNTEVQAARCQAAIRLGALDVADRILDQLGPTGGLDRVFLTIRLAAARRKAGDRDGAQALLRHLLDTFPTSPYNDTFRPRVMQALLDAGDLDRVVSEARTRPTLEAPDTVHDLMAAARAYDATGNTQAAADARQLAHDQANARRALDEAEPLPPTGLSMLDENGDPIPPHDTPAVRLSYGRKRLAEMAEALGEPAEADRLAHAIPTPSLRDETKRDLQFERALAASPAPPDPSLPLDLRLELIGRQTYRQAEQAGVEGLVIRSVQP